MALSQIDRNGLNMPASYSPAAAREILPSMPRIVVVSPHLDDAVLSCGALLGARPGSTVVTVYTGMPDAAHVLTDWDRRCGFGSAAEAMRERRREDARAMALVRGRGRALGFLDSQYAACADACLPALTEALMRTLAELRPDAVAIPLGLLHADHVRVSDAGLMVRDAWRGPAWLAYEDVPYRCLPGIVQARFARLHGRGVIAAPADLALDTRAKPRAVAAYASQLKGLQRAPADLGREERYWHLVDG